MPKKAYPKAFIVSITIILVMFTLAALALVLTRPQQANALDSFAQCLAAKEVTMYGANWCSHCQNEKKAFGSSFEHVPYVECPTDPKRCQAAGVEGYPTWIFPDGRKLVGEQGLAKLSRESGCALPQ